MLIGSQPDSGMAIMWGMQSQVFCSFDVAGFFSKSCWIPLKSMDSLNWIPAASFNATEK